MGTRADFYMGRGEDAEWVGSIAWDGYPTGIPDELLKATDESEYVRAIKGFFASRDDVTLPEEGWPWPWENSATTDYAYALEDGKVYASCFGGPWHDPTKSHEELVEEYGEDEYEEPKLPGDPAVFPDMTKIQNVKLGGKQSGIMIVGIDPQGNMSIE